MNMKPKATKNHPKSDQGAVWAPKAVSGTRPDALGTAFGRQSAAPRSIGGRPGRAKSGEESSKREPRPPRRRSKTLPVSRPSARGLQCVGISSPPLPLAAQAENPGSSTPSPQAHEPPTLSHTYHHINIIVPSYHHTIIS